VFATVHFNESMHKTNCIDLIQTFRKEVSNRMLVSIKDVQPSEQSIPRRKQEQFSRAIDPVCFANMNNL
jgi:hypothetical protein